MLTRLNFQAPVLTGDWAKDGPNFVKFLTEWFNRLNSVGSLTITEASIDGTPIGGSDPAAGDFTTVETTGKAAVGQSVGTAQFEVNGAIRSVADNGGFFTKEATATAGGNVTITTGTRGIAVAANQSNGESALLLFDSATGVINIVSQTTAGAFVTADPGAGTSKIWASFNTNDLVFTNRWAASKIIHVTVISTANLPS